MGLQQAFTSTTCSHIQGACGKRLFTTVLADSNGILSCSLSNIGAASLAESICKNISQQPSMFSNTYEQAGDRQIIMSRAGGGGAEGEEGRFIVVEGGVSGLERGRALHVAHTGQKRSLQAVSTGKL